ncbi:tubulin-specific chaperone D, partial [Lecanoromycetidae sp. Uapishka_2]
MDAAEDQDISLRKSAPLLIAELKASVPRFLWKTKTTDGRPSRRVRLLVHKRKTDQLIQLVSPSYGLLILYVMCKVRGQKVIVQQLNNEAKYMEPMLTALETWGQSGSQEEPSTPKVGMTWEERFIMLLWLSHFMLAPFDLVTMASEDTGLSPSIPSTSVSFLENTPPVAKRLVRLCIFYISFASKERETASMLLARLALRADMRWIGLQKTLIDWARSSVDGTRDGPVPTIHALLGTLSFLAKFITSAEKNALIPFFMPIYQSIQLASSHDSFLQTRITSSPAARKLIIKINRTLAVAGIKMNSAGLTSGFSLDEVVLEEIIDQMLTFLEDQDTSIRVAASKALSVIAIHLDSGMVSQIVEIVLEKFREDSQLKYLQMWQEVTIPAVVIRDWGPPPIYAELSLANVNPVKWHGLVLTISQLIFHGCMPAQLISEAFRVLDLALSFEQRASSGAAVGTNVRDAACFGLWSLARRYSTEELSKLDRYCVTEKSSKNSYKADEKSIFQTLANRLVVAATTDPAGNIRRGASAALQELVGRHPDTIADGIRLVEIVDYHAVASRSRALTEVAVATSKIHKTYWNTVMKGLLDWRGIASPDAQSRRHAAMAIGLLTLTSDPKVADMDTVEAIRNCLRKTAFSDLRKRHGLLLAMAEIVLVAHECNSKAAKHIVDNPDKYDPDNDDFQIVFFPDEEAAKLWQSFYVEGPKSFSGVGEVELFKVDVALHLESPLIAEAHS